MEKCHGDVQWRVRLFETVFIVESWNIAVNLDGILLFELSAQFSYSYLYVLKKVNLYRMCCLPLLIFRTSHT